MNLITLEQVDSTNIYAKSNIDVLEDKTLVMARRQVSGKGRLNRSWVDLGDGNLFLSIVLKPSSEFREVYSNLTQYMSVVLCKTLESYGVNAQIKWPNDVLINGKKVAGILSETVMRGKTLNGLVLGLGVNLNAKQEDIDSIPDKIATSLNLELNRFINLNDFMTKLTELFFEQYDNFIENGFESIKSDYISRVAFLDTEISVKGFNDIKTGIARDITDNGELVLENNGSKLVLNIGDIL